MSLMCASGLICRALLRGNNKRTAQFDSKVAPEIGQTVRPRNDILCAMIFGAHFLLYSKDADADRAFFRDVLGFHSVDAGGGWLIFAMPPSEVGIHPIDHEFSFGHAGHPLVGSVLYLMCDDINSTTSSLKTKGVQCSKLETAEWGITTTIPLPSGGRIGLYQPKHPLAVKVR
jgi:catechol 2,3-dioxygenase-like lactoylglutathione lyase family enzyme